MRYLKIYLILTVLCLILPISSRGLGGSQQEKNSEPAEATLYDYTSRKSFPEIFSAYTVPFVPRARLENSRLLSELIADGKLKLSLEDAIVLALENNLDIAVARYDLPIAQTDLLRAKAGCCRRLSIECHLFRRYRRWHRQWQEQWRRRRGDRPGGRHSVPWRSGLLRPHRQRVLRMGPRCKSPELHGGERCAH